MVKSLPKILYHGTKLLFKAIHKSLKQEIELSRDAAKIRYGNQQEEKSKKPEEMSLEEAKSILNIVDLDPEEIEKNYRYLFHANSQKKGGSFYLQSKVIQARKRVYAEIENANENMENISISNKQI